MQIRKHPCVLHVVAQRTGHGGRSYGSYGKLGARVVNCSRTQGLSECVLVPQVESARKRVPTAAP